MSEDALVFTGKGIDFNMLAARKAACKAHLRGMKHSSGKSVIAFCKKYYGLRGKNEYVVEQLEAMVAGAIAVKEYERGQDINLQDMVNQYKWGELQVAFIRGVQGEY